MPPPPARPRVFFSYSRKDAPLVARAADIFRAAGLEVLRDVEFVSKFDRVIPLDELRETPGLEKMQVARKGQRLSVMPVEEPEWSIVMGLPGAK